MTTQLEEFIKDATKAGKSRAEIDAALADAGWSGGDRSKAWSNFHDKPFPVAIPLPSSYASPRLTALNTFYFIVLYITLYSAITILFTFLDYHLPDGLGRKAGAFYSATTSLDDSIRSALSSLLVALPLTLFSKNLTHKAMANARQFIPAIRLKLLNITLLIGSLILLCNFISFVYYLLSGELGIRFVIKVCILSSMCAGLYAYFKPEILQNEKAQG